MMGEDVTATLTGLIKHMLEILMMLLRWLEEHHNRHRGEHLFNFKPKIKYGSINKKTLDKLKHGGDKPRILTVPADKLGDLNKIAKEMGAQYFVSENLPGEKTARILVPESSLSQINDAINLLSQKMFTENKDSIKIHGSDEAIADDKRDIINETIDTYDLPVYRVVRGDGKQVNIVPSEYEEEYAKVMKEAEKISDRLEHDVVVEKYNPSVPVESVDFTIRRTDSLEAANLISAFGNEVELLTDGKEYAVKYNDSVADKINAAFGDTEKQIAGIKTAIVDNTISINKSLIAKEEENRYLVRIPNTKAQDFMWIDKQDIDTRRSTDNTLYSSIDLNKSYTVCDESGSPTRVSPGEDVALKWKTRNILGNKDTKITHHGSDNFERLEIYDPVKNKLLSIELNAETAKQTLMSNGFTAIAADRLLSAAVREMSEETKEKFGFEEIYLADKARKTDSVENAVKESEIAHLVRDAEFKGDKQTFSGEECICVYEKTSRKYTVVSAETSPDSVKKALTDIGCSDIERNVLSARIASDLLIEEKKVPEPKYFDTNMDELNGACWYYSKELNQAVIIRPDNDDLKYAFVPPCTRAEFEKLLTDKSAFGLTELAAAELARCCIENDISNLVEAPQTSRIKDTPFTETQLTSKYIRISDGNKDIVVEPEKVTDELLKSSFAVSDAAALAAATAINESFKPKQDNEKLPLKQRVNEVKEKVAEKVRQGREQINTVMDSKGKASETHSLNQSERTGR